ncbi:MAG TPA: hypothetical protein EYG74_08710 [Sulfurimonas autotrophica]|nr:hypothetical protein [Sulfurimonas autotrophica]
MTINTKFNTEEYTYIIRGSKVIQVVVHDIKISVEEEAIISYVVIQDDAYNRIIDEEDMYKTRKEAILAMVRQSGYEIHEDDLKEI